MFARTRVTTPSEGGRTTVAFVKLDCGMLTSTIWDDYPARSIFITALLMAEPREYAEPVPQIEVRSLNYTGWSAPPNWYGFVPAAGIGIIKRAGDLDADTGYAALERLGSPEPESRSQDHEGRRLIRIDGGYLVLNFDKYRQRDYGAADRMRRLRDRRKEESRQVTLGRYSSPNDRDVTANVTHTEAEAEAETEAETDTEAETFWFESVWKEYPRKIEKSSARKKFYSVVKSRSLFSQMLSAVRNYATEVKLNGTEQKYIKHAATFFNGPWKDYIDGVWTPPVQKSRLPPVKPDTLE